MMKEYINEIVAAEKKAHQDIEKARDDAKRVRLRAEEEAEDLIRKTREQGISEKQKRLKEAEAEARAKKENMLNEAETDPATFMDSHESRVQSVVTRLFLKITGKKEQH